MVKLIISISDGEITLSGKTGLATIPLADLPAAAKEELQRMGSDIYGLDLPISLKGLACRTFQAEVSATSALNSLYLSEFTPKDLV